MNIAPLDLLTSSRVLPVLTIATGNDAFALRDGLHEGGLLAAEVTLRSDFALDAIRTMSNGGLKVGAGTVLSVDDAQRAVGAGAAYLVSPGTSPAVLEWCLANNVTVIPGVATPTEAMHVSDLGITVMKFFPASVSGGPGWLRAVGAPLPGLTFVATGGVTDATLPAYLAAPNLLAVGGSWFLPAGEPLTAEAVADGVRGCGRGSRGSPRSSGAADDRRPGGVG